MGKKFEISEELVQKLVRYLAEKPFKEVVHIMNEITQLKPIAQEEKK